MDNTGIYIKALVTSLLAGVSLKLGHMGELLWLFAAALILDYITGVVAAAYNREISSGTGFRGVVKKVSQCAVIAVAAMSDEVVSQTSVYFGAAFSTRGMFVTVVTIWLVLNELISILENVAEMGVDLPPFMLSTLKLLKKNTETSAEKSLPDDCEESDSKQARNIK